MSTHTNTKKKLQKQIILIDIFYSKYKENLLYNFDSSTGIITKTEGIITKTGGIIAKDHYVKHPIITKTVAIILNALSYSNTFLDTKYVETKRVS